MNDGDFCVDEAPRRESLERLTNWTGSLADAYWHSSMWADFDAAEALANKERMKMQLARYGKLGRPDEHLGWGEVEAVQVRRYHARLKEILDEEGASAGTED